MKEDFLYKIFQDYMNQQAQAQTENAASGQEAERRPSRTDVRAPEQSQTKITQDVLVRSVTATYFAHLKSYGHVPFDMIKVVLEDLEQEVTEMYRKKTYGHFNLKSYLRQTKSKRK